MGKQVVIGIFANEAAADAAVEALKDWDKLDHDVRLKAMGVLTLDENGNVNEHKLGRHVTGKGAAGGYVLGTVAVALSPAFGLGLLGWTLVGAAVGRSTHKGLGLSEEDLDRIHDEVWGGKAAVGVLVRDDEVPAVLAKLAELGGEPEAHAVSDEDLSAAEATEAEAAAAAAASGDPDARQEPATR